MKRIKKLPNLLIPALCILLAGCTVFASCDSAPAPYVIGIEKTDTQGNQDIYTIYFSDGSTNNFSVTNGKDGENAPLTVKDAYDYYVEQYGDISYEEFLSLYFSSTGDEEISKAISKATTSCVTLYTEFTEKSSGGTFIPGYGTVSSTTTAIFTGSGVIYTMSSAYTYIITNYHVIYDENAYGEKITDTIHCYLYGSEFSPVKVSENEYDYGSYAISCEYVGGSASTDIALIRAKTEDIAKINPNVSAITFADDYYLGETAIAIGNAGGIGQNVTKGIVSSANENITLSVDGISRTYRSIKMDAVIYQGSSGGGLFNAKGELIGITNAGEGSEEQSMNYAVPLEIVRNVASGILYYYTDGVSGTVDTYKMPFGITVSEKNVRSVYDSSSGRIVDSSDNLIESVKTGSIAESLGLKAGDSIVSMTVAGKTTKINRSYNISDAAYAVRPGNTISVTYLRNGVEGKSSSYTVKQADLLHIDTVLK